MKNKMSDLNDHLFMQLERLADEDQSDEQRESEIRRADSMVRVSDQIIKNAALRLSAARLYAEHGDSVLPMLPLIGGKE